MVNTPLQAATVEQQESMQTTLIGSTSEIVTTLMNTCVAQEEHCMLPVSPSHKRQAHRKPETQRPSQPLSGSLTTRELEVLHLMAQGASNVEIADALVIAFATVKRHVSNILSKLQATNRTQAVAYARRLSLLR